MIIWYAELRGTFTRDIRRVSIEADESYPETAIRQYLRERHPSYRIESLTRQP